ncbi:MAG: tRNA (N6-threonylcarbamoyladenosine(37)-N6)-methyltransferase TrmO [Bdellovibrionales bacterium]|nr:tRNA (N6-threonylcarbamoyladenosine(37)-N6)-methyltransferase TrmO [Bdellovibrionales bacterium]
MKIESIGIVRSSRIKVEDDNWDAETSHIELNSEYSEEALFGLSDFSHVEILFYMDQVDPTKVERTARHPRNNLNWPKIGIFAQRGKNRPNQIGTTVCEILKVDGKKLFLKGLDAVDGTPVLDIKPWVKEFGPRSEPKQPSWISELMKGYWK